MDEVLEGVTVRAPAPAVWVSLVDVDARGQWRSDLELEPVEGGSVLERWTDERGEAMTTAGSVVELVPERRVRMTWRDDGWPASTEVEISLDPVEDGTVVTVRHRGWAALPDAAGLVAAHRAGWRMHLEDLRRHAEASHGSER